MVPFGEGVLKLNGMLVSYFMQTHFNLDFRLTLGIMFLPMFLFCGNLRGGQGYPIFLVKNTLTKKNNVLWLRHHKYIEFRFGGLPSTQ